MSHTKNFIKKKKKMDKKKLLINELKRHALRFRGRIFITAHGSMRFPILLVFS